MLRIAACLIALLSATLLYADAPPATQPTPVQELERQIPDGVVPRDPAQWNEVKLRVANEALAASTRRFMRISVNVQEIHQDRDGTWIRATPTDTSNLPMSVDARCQQVDQVALARLEKGDMVKLEGTINYVKLRPTQSAEGMVLLDLNLTQVRFLSDPVRGGVEGPAEAPPAPKVVGDLDAVIETALSGVIPGKDEGWNDARFALANAGLTNKVVGRQFHGKVSVDSVILEQERYVVTFKGVLYDTFAVDISASFGFDQLRNVALLKAGQVVTLQGVITEAAIGNEGSGPRLRLFVGAGQINP